MEKKLLTIAITSYNRPRELVRCLKSVDSSRVDLFEVIISEDKSPKRDEIKHCISEIKNEVPYTIIDNYNINNLGYDRNLKQLINLSNSKYILFISDDDCLVKGALDVLLDDLSNIETGIYYSPFYNREFNNFGRYYKSSLKISNGKSYLKKHIYDSILFSGLCFNTELVKKLDAEPFLNKNYFQVFLFMYALNFSNGYYSNNFLIDCIGDGENGYGSSDSAEKNELLVNRKSYLSNLQFHTGLIWVIKYFDSLYHTNYFTNFEKEYNLHTFTGLYTAAKIGKTELNLYWEKLNSLDIKINIISKIYYFLFLKLSVNKVVSFLLIIKKILYKLRHQL